MSDTAKVCAWGIPKDKAPVCPAVRPERLPTNACAHTCEVQLQQDIVIMLCITHMPTSVRTCAMCVLCYVRFVGPATKSRDIRCTASHRATHVKSAAIKRNSPQALPNAMTARSKLIKAISVKSSQMRQSSPRSINGNDEGEEGGVKKRTVAKAINPKLKQSYWSKGL